MFEYIIILPEVIIRRVKEYIPMQYAVNLNRAYYRLYGSENRQFIPDSYFNSYIRDIDVGVDDNGFVVDYVMREYSTSWKKKQKYKYGNSLYSEFLQKYSFG